MKSKLEEHFARQIKARDIPEPRWVDLRFARSEEQLDHFPPHPKTTWNLAEGGSRAIT